MFSLGGALPAWHSPWERGGEPGWPHQCGRPHGGVAHGQPPKTQVHRHRQGDRGSSSQPWDRAAFPHPAFAEHGKRSSVLFLLKLLILVRGFTDGRRSVNGLKNQSPPPYPKTLSLRPSIGPSTASWERPSFCPPLSRSPAYLGFLPSQAELPSRPTLVFEPDTVSREQRTSLSSAGTGSESTRHAGPCGSQPVSAQ